MKNKNYSEIHPREIANKANKQNLMDAIEMALAIESEAVKKNTAVFNSNRYSATSKLIDYEELKEKARKIKERAIDDLPQLIEQLKSVIEEKGGSVFIAKNANEATNYIKEICKKKNAKIIVKAKSITSEEIGLNEVLERIGVEVAETDLAEFILQLSKEQPSHNVAPALHQSRERISKLFKEHFKTDLLLETGEDLTKFARNVLRNKFLAADIGISGANCISADTGSILLVESEGNIRLTTNVPATHIAIAGIEKIIHNYSDLAVFIELLAASGTGQSLTSYTNIISPPVNLPILNLNGREEVDREFHLVLIDNGRMKMREDPVLYEALYCIRCSACMNVCANFQSVGGHAFGGECYTGGIGGAWTVGTSGNISNARFAELCTGCSRCVPNCPVKINIPGLNTEIKNRIIKKEGGPSLQKTFLGNFSKVAKLTSNFPSFANFGSNLSVSKMLMDKIIGFDVRRTIPKFSKKTLDKLYSEYRKDHQEINSDKKVILFADVFTNYNNAEVGMSVISVFDKLNINISLSKSLEDGRALLSQGLIDDAKAMSDKLLPYLEELIDMGYDIIVSEPSVLTMFRFEYENLINDKKLFDKIKSNCFDPFEYLNIISEEIRIENYTTKNIVKEEIVYHAHCQLKSIGLGMEVPKLFNRIGVKISETSAECCGMAGSFGYKKEFYNLSKKVGEYLGEEIKKRSPKIIIANGTSCREQIKDEINSKVIHPIELLEKYIS